MLDILGQLTVQELGRIGTLGADQAPVGEAQCAGGQGIGMHGDDYHHGPRRPSPTLGDVRLLRRVGGRRVRPSSLPFPADR